jgi:putative glycosyltransferase
MYNNSAHVNEFVKACINVADRLQFENYEIIVVDDCSKDDTYDQLLSLSKNLKKLKIIKLNKNSGQAFSLITGFKHAKGDYIFTLDSDMDENPNDLVNFYKKIIETNLDIIFSYTKVKEDNLVNKIFSNIYYFITFILRENSSNYYKNRAGMHIFNRKVNETFKNLNDQEIEIISHLDSLKFKQDSLEIIKTNKSTSNYNLPKKIDIFLNFIMSNLNKKIIQLLIFLSLCFSLIFFTLSILNLINYITTDVRPGFTSLILSIWFIGTILIMLVTLNISVNLRLKKLLEKKNNDNIENKINF